MGDTAEPAVVQVAAARQAVSVRGRILVALGPALPFVLLSMWRGAWLHGAAHLLVVVGVGCLVQAWFVGHLRPSSARDTARGRAGGVVDCPDWIEVTSTDVTLVDHTCRERLPGAEGRHVSLRAGGALGAQLRIPVGDGAVRRIMVAQMDLAALREAFVSRGWSWQDAAG